MLTENMGLVAPRIRHLTTNQGIPGASLGKVVIFCLMLRHLTTNQGIPGASLGKVVIFCLMLR